MIKKVKITFDRYKLMRRVIMEAQNLRKICENNASICTQALIDAVNELDRAEAVELTDQFASGHKDHNRRRELPTFDCGFEDEDVQPSP